MSVPNLVRKYLCYDLETCFVNKGCTRGQTKILEIAFKTENRSYQHLVNPLPFYSNAKEIIDGLEKLNQNSEKTVHFWTKLLIGKKALPSSLRRKSVIEKAEAIATLLKRSDVAMSYNKHVRNGMMQSLARHEDDEIKAKNDIRKDEDSFNQLFYSPKEAIRGMLNKAEGIDIWVAHNGKAFDEKVLKGHDHDFDHVIFIDSLHLLRQLKPGLVSYSQPLLYQHLFNKKYFAHHALEDAVALHKIMDHTLGEKCILETFQSTVEKKKEKKARYKQLRAHPESSLYKLKGIGEKTVEKLYKKDIKTDEELLLLINTISFDAWCRDFNFVHRHKKFFTDHCTVGSNTAIV